MRFTLLLPALIVIAGCDRQSPANGQANQAPAATLADDANAITPDEVAAPAGNAAPPAALGQPDRSHHGDPAPTAAFQMPGGGALTLGAFAGKPYLLNLWATWCGPCKVEMPALDAIAGEGRLAVVTIAQDLDGAKVVQPYFAKAAFKALKPYTDPDNRVAQALGNPSLPTTILYDGNGREVWRHTGGMDWTTPKARKLLAEAR